MLRNTCALAPKLAKTISASKASVLIAALIFVPTTYELRDLSPKHLGTLLLKGQIRKFCSLPYHYINRLRYYFKLLIRRLTKRNFVLPLLVNKGIVTGSKPTRLHL